jgi:hypothetical protein
MGEYVDQELGGYKLAFARRAEEAERHGGFLFAEKKASARAWREWWKGLGKAAPGLTRAGPDGVAAVDETVNFGAWWHSGEHFLRQLVPAEHLIHVEGDPTP